MTIVDGFRENFIFHLDRLAEEIAAYSDEANFWRREGAVNNSAGNLCLHLVGNLEHFIGAQMGRTGYQRDREAEFATRDVPREELLRQVAGAREVVGRTLRGLADADLAMEVRAPIWNDPQPLARWLGWLLSHLGYHVGQISYHRRILDR